MKQSGYYATHRGSGEDGNFHPRLEIQTEASPFSIPTSQHGPSTGALDGVTFSRSRKLRGLTLDGPSPVHLRVGEREAIVINPGENRFHPPIPIQPGESLRLEPVDSSIPGGHHE